LIFALKQKRITNEAMLDTARDWKEECEVTVGLFWFCWKPDSRLWVSLKQSLVGSSAAKFALKRVVSTAPSEPTAHYFKSAFANAPLRTMLHFLFAASCAIAAIQKCNNRCGPDVRPQQLMKVGRKGESMNGCGFGS
jgi:hypothetical protein